MAIFRTKTQLVFAGITTSMYSRVQADFERNFVIGCDLRSIQVDIIIIISNLNEQTNELVLSRYFLDLCGFNLKGFGFDFFKRVGDKVTFARKHSW